MWKAAFALHGQSSPLNQRWVSERLLEILRGNASAVAAGMRRSATLRGMKTKKRLPIDDCADYLLNYRDHVGYDRYLAGGLPIATGVIEGACRHLVKDRMDITGACWGLEGAEAILKLRSLRASGDLESYWTYHENVEKLRNHVTHYEGTPPATKIPLRLRGRGYLRLVN